MGIFSLKQELAIDLGTANTLIIYNGKMCIRDRLLWGSSYTSPIDASIISTRCV